LDNLLALSGIDLKTTALLFEAITSEHALRSMSRILNKRIELALGTMSRPLED
jgi:hypothetical protein